MNSRVVTPRPISFLSPTPTSAVMGNRAFLRMWAARRAARQAEAAKPAGAATPAASPPSALVPLNLSN